MKKSLSIYCILFISVLLCISGSLLCTAEASTAKTVLLDDDFSTVKSYTAFTGTYTEVSGIGNSAPAIHLQSGQRLTHQVGARSSGVYVVEFDFMKPDNSATGIFWELTDARGGNNAANMSCDGSGIYMFCYDADGNGQTVALDEFFSAGKWYHISVTVDIDNKMLAVWVDGRRVVKEKILYYNPDIEFIGRFFDSRCYRTEYYLDNLNIYEDLVSEDIGMTDIYKPDSDISLPSVSKSGNGVITWKSSYTTAISHAGKLRVQPDYDTSVTLTATVTYDSFSETRDYIVRLGGHNGSITKVENHVDDFYYMDEFSLPSIVNATTSGGSKIILPVKWEDTLDVDLLEEKQIVYGVVSNGVSTVKAIITVHGAFVIQRVAFADDHGNTVIKMPESGAVSHIAIEKKATRDLIGNIRVAIVDENGDTISEELIELSSIDSWQPDVMSIIPINLELDFEDVDTYSIVVSVEDDYGTSYCEPFIHQSNETRYAPANIIIAGNSSVADFGRQVSPNNPNVKGWGEVLGHFFDTEVSITNFSSPKANISKLYDINTISGTVTDGDYVLVDFGNTDSTVLRKSEYPSAEEFEDSLVEFIDIVYSKKAIPVLLAPVLSSPFAYDDLQSAYVNKIYDVSDYYRVPLIDISDKAEERLNELSYDIYFTEDGRYLTMDGAIQFSKILVEEMDAIETYIDGYMRYDVVNNAENPENFDTSSYRVNRLRLFDSENNEVYKFSDATKIGAVTVELRSDSPKEGTAFVAVYKNGKLAFVEKYIIPTDGEWKKNCLKDIPVDIDISSHGNSDVQVKVMLTSGNVLPYSNAYHLDK